jgi:hypothetical protein
MAMGAVIWTVIPWSSGRPLHGHLDGRIMVIQPAAHDANFAITQPPLKLVLIEGAAGEPTRMDHLGAGIQQFACG